MGNCQRKARVKKIEGVNEQSDLALKENTTDAVKIKQPKQASQEKPSTVQTTVNEV